MQIPDTEPAVPRKLLNSLRDAVELMPRLVVCGREIRRYCLANGGELFRLPSPLGTLHPSGADGVLLDSAEMAGRCLAVRRAPTLWIFLERSRRTSPPAFGLGSP